MTTLDKWSALHKQQARDEEKLEKAIALIARLHPRIAKRQKRLDKLEAKIDAEHEKEKLVAAAQSAPEVEPIDDDKLDEAIVQLVEEAKRPDMTKGQDDGPVAENLVGVVLPEAKADDGLDIPDYLRRLWSMPDPRAPEKKAERRKVEAEVRHAELTGQRRAMPLQGREALAAIRAG